MSVAKFSVGKSGAGGANASYITRQPDAEKIAFYNLNHLVVETNAEMRTNAIAYAYSREDIEKDKSKNARTHYRMILSWDRKEDSEKASAEAEKYLDKVLPKAKAILAVHQDTDHTHVHIWIDARQTDDKKINLRSSEYTTLDEKWARHYDAEYNTSYAEEYKLNHYALEVHRL
jgi:Relaxase/Mobilisation nuclease domain